MKLTVLTADAVQVDPTGKVHALGLGWSQTGTPTDPMSLLMFVDFEAPQDVGMDLALDVACFGPDNQVAMTAPEGQLLQFQGHLTASVGAFRAIGVISLGPLQLEPGKHRWDVAIQGTDYVTSVPFEAVPRG